MKIPYGYYLNDKNEVSIDSAKADAVIMIYDMYIEGISLRKISQKLTLKDVLLAEISLLKTIFKRLLANTKVFPLLVVEKCGSTTMYFA